ncbi:hypothetical protein DACRYDRAFT_20260 [Dacryopinax primogenitus]|uniref:Extracellular membrane protein CFEM domain-containing protein n=1 Tax=Dacryopinax primogenitus (strain DJM 731) TaxID=1858805 RepID=M5GFY4_DACPD|nr:uncharacterized protein DACRYDRAFT_20260 [Dacryopinax primogenitus]EJU04553.1 hypothetical protein DACRYDRAFT_20260 [Dacryopinax primogenitus]
MKLTFLSALALLATGAISKPSLPRAHVLPRQASGTDTAPGSIPSAGAICASQCSSSSDQGLLAQLSTGTCDSVPACVCGTLESLSSACVTCVLGAEGLSVADLEAECGALSSSLPAGSGSGTDTGSASAPTQGSDTSLTTSSAPTSAPASNTVGGGGGILTGSSTNSSSSTGTGTSSAPASSSPASGQSAALPNVDLRMAVVVLSGLAVGSVLLL